MGISVLVGVLAEPADDGYDDPEMRESIVAELEQINEVLALAGLPVHREPTGGEPYPGFDGLTHESLECLQGVYSDCMASAADRMKGTCAAVCSGAELAADGLPAPLRNARGSGAFDETLLRKARSPSHHLLWHSFGEGYFIPIDFPLVIEDEGLVGGRLGSSRRLQAELLRMAAPLGIALDGTELPQSESRRNLAARRRLPAWRRVSRVEDPLPGGEPQHCSRSRGEAQLRAPS